MAENEFEIDNTLRLTSDENGFLQLIAEFADTKDPKAKEQLTEFLRTTDLERVRRIGSAIVGQPVGDLHADELRLAAKFQKMIVDYRRNIRLFDSIGQEGVLAK